MMSDNEVRKELFSEKIDAGSRTYLFDVKQSADGARYLLIRESRHRDRAPCIRDQIIVFPDHLPLFLAALQDAVRSLEKSGRPKPYLARVRDQYPAAYAKWTEQEDANLRTQFAKGLPVDKLSKLFGRRPGAIRARLEKLGLLGER